MSGDIPAALREGLRRLAKAVVVITCRHEGVRFAMAATAVTELSMDPPSLLICVNRSASLHAPLSGHADFCVNILRSDQADLAAACSGQAKGEARFETGRWRGADHEPPWLEDAQASFLCRQQHGIDYGTHRIVIGEVEAVRLHGGVDPLVYVDGRFARVG